jgi:hypothetical protein
MLRHGAAQDTPPLVPQSVRLLARHATCSTGIAMARHFALAASALLVAVLLAGACDSSSGQAQCEAAGGQCVLGAARCANPGTQDCNPDLGPGGAFCCLAGLCTAGPVQASSYDQTCKVDTDCVSIAEGDPCAPCGLSCSMSATINAGALARYNADIASTPAVRSAADGGCLDTCGTVSGRSDYGPFCCGGMCHIGGPCPGVDGGAVEGGPCNPGLNAQVAAVLSASWGPACGPCAQAQCCAQLTACDTPGDAGIDTLGFTGCGEALRCTFGYVSGAGAARDGSADASPDFDAAAVACRGMADETGQANANAVMGCVRSGCGSECEGF